MKHLLLFLALFFGGCVDSGLIGIVVHPNETLHISRKFTEDEQEQITRAVAEWNKALPELNLSVSFDDMIHFEWRIIPFEGESSGRYGNTSYDKKTVKIDPKLLCRHWGCDHVYSTTLHELGHVLGIRGDTGPINDSHLPKGLMEAQHAGWMCVDRDTLNALCNLRGSICDGAKPTCEEE
jgi:hypothetical protein